MMHWDTSCIRYQCILVFISVKIHFFKIISQKTLLIQSVEGSTTSLDKSETEVGLRGSVMWPSGSEKPGEPGECSHLSDVYLQSALEIFAYKSRAPPLADSSPWDGLLQPDKPLQSVRRRRKFQRGARRSQTRTQSVKNRQTRGNLECFSRSSADFSVLFIFCRRS